MATIVFMGTPDFAVPALKRLHERFGVRAVVTVPDKPQGRGRHIKPSAVKEAAVDLGIDLVMQPGSLRDPSFIAALQEIDPDIICVIAFRILPRSVYSLARIGSFNVHASLLPRHRGAAPINHAILQGDRRTGVTSFLLNDVVDTGTILLQQETEIDDGMTAGDLYERLKPLAASCAVDTVEVLMRGEIAPAPQDEALATPAPKVFRETAQISWNAPCNEVRNFIHGLSPAPCAWTKMNGEVLKIYRASISQEQCQAGSFRILDGGIIAGCADGALSLDEIQFPGRRRMTALESIAGYRGPMTGTFA
jgi:methionyl-tRNA formyltransferase